jgi:orotidine-5'-phosphate decarboxylase
MTQNHIIVALDVDSADAARALVARLGDRIRFYEVGMELYAAAGMISAPMLSSDVRNPIFFAKPDRYA